jgi:hypothetical protein
MLEEELENIFADCEVNDKEGELVCMDWDKCNLKIRELFTKILKDKNEQITVLVGENNRLENQCFENYLNMTKI